MMSLATTTPIPTAAELAATFTVIPDEDLVHVVWSCDLDHALCGEPILGDDFVDGDDSGPWCPECVAIDQAQEAAHKAQCSICQKEDQ